MRCLTSTDGGPLPYFDNINNTDAKKSININSLNDRLINSHSVEVERRKIKCQMPLKLIFGFLKIFTKITKTLGFRLIFKTADIEDFFFTTMANDINVTISILYLYVSMLIPNSDSQVMFNESIESNYTITYDSWYVERKISTDGNEFHVGIGSAQHINIPGNLLPSFQKSDRILTPYKNYNTAFFDNVNVKKYLSEFDGARFPKGAVLTNFPEIDYLDQYRDPKLFYKEYVGEELMVPFIKYTDMKNKYPI